MAIKGETSNHLKGITFTLVFHSIVIATLMMITLTTNPPMFPEVPTDGVEVNFGDGDTGLGDQEPGPASPTDEAVSPEETQQEATTTQTQSMATTDNQADLNENVLTQVGGDADISMAEKRKADEQVKQAQIAQQKIEDEKKRVAAEQQKQIDKFNKIASSAFGKGTGSGGQGIAGGPGNQGKETGVLNSKNYVGPGGNGKAGVNYDLAGRKSVDLPSPAKGIQAAGKVVVEILVDRDGHVIDARPGVRGSTINNQQLYDAAQKAAMNTTFNVSPNSAERQKGFLTYIFELQ